MNWGKWIVVSFLLFAVFIISLVVVCVRQDMNLVSKSYYKEELAYQDQIDRINNTRALNDKPVFTIAGDSLMIQYDELGELDSARVELFRPSDESFDRHYSIAHGPTDIFKANVADLPHGLYKVRMTWALDEKEYFIEDQIHL